jgi:hypothetical protein
VAIVPLHKELARGTLRSALRAVRETAAAAPGGLAGRRSHADDEDEFAKSGEVVAIPGVEHKAIGVRSGCDQQVGDAPSVRPPRFGDGCLDLSVGPRCGGIEGEWLEVRLYLFTAECPDGATVIRRPPSGSR